MNSPNVLLLGMRGTSSKPSPLRSQVAKI